MKTFEQLKEQAQVISTEVNKGANTTGRVGGMMSDMLDFTEGTIKDSILKSEETTNEKLRTLDGNMRDVSSKGALSLNGYIGLDGYFVTSPAYKATDYIKITEKQGISISKGFSGESSCLLYFYDENKNPITGYNNLKDIILSYEDIPKEAYYFRASSRLAESNDMSIFVASIIDILHDVNYMSDDIKLLFGNDQSALKRWKDKFDKILLFPDKGYVNGDGGMSLTDKAKNTGYIDISGYKILTYNAALSAPSYVVAFFDKEKTLLKDISVVGTGKLAKGVVDLSSPNYAAVKFCIVSHYASDGNFDIAYCCLSNLNSVDERLRENESRLNKVNADITKIGSATNNNIQQTVGVISSNACTLNGYIHFSHGGFTDNPSYMSTPELILDRESDMVVNNGKVGDSASILSFYDRAHQYLKGYNNLTSIHLSKVDYPSNAFYYRCSSLKEGCENFTIQNSSLLSLSQGISRAEEENETLIRKIYNTDAALVMHGYFRLVDGGFTSTDRARSTRIIPIDGYDKITYSSNISTNAYMLAFFDKSGARLDDVSLHGEGKPVSGYINLLDTKYDNVGYVQLSCYDGSEEFAAYHLILSSEKTMDSRVSKLESKNIHPIYPTDGDKIGILIFGDSIVTTANISYDETPRSTSYENRELTNSYVRADGKTVRFNMWPSLLPKYLDCYDLRNYAQSGASYKDAVREKGLERQNLSFQISLALNDSNNPLNIFPTKGEFTPDIIIFSLATNDGDCNDTYESAMKKTILKEDGSFDVQATLDNLDKSKFCEAARWAFLKMKDKYPYSQYICILPIQRASRDNISNGANSQLRKVAERYSIHVIDGAKELGIIRDLQVEGTFGKGLKDGLHPDEHGQLMYLRMVINAIKSTWFNTKYAESLIRVG